MQKLLEKHKLWNLFKCKEADEKGKNKGKGKGDDHNDDEDDDYEEEEDDEGDSIVTDSASGTDEELTHLSTIKDDIRMLTDNDLLNPQSADKFQTSLKRISGTQIAMFCSVSPSDCMETHQKQKEQSKFTPFVQVKIESKDIFIQKTTAVWLLQEGERVSSSRLIRVRATQPFSSTGCSHRMKVQQNEDKPIVDSKIKIGEICMFKSGEGSNWSIGKVLQFSKYKNKWLKHQDIKSFLPT